jgi:hypothetical protein
MIGFLPFLFSFSVDCLIQLLSPKILEYLSFYLPGENLIFLNLSLDYLGLAE